MSSASLLCLLRRLIAAARPRFVALFLSGLVGAGLQTNGQSTAENLTVDLHGTDTVHNQVIVGGNMSHFNTKVSTWPQESFDQIKQLGITYLRSHDIKALDWDIIFPDWNADPEDPNSYHFLPGDTILKAVVDHGFKLLLRTGVSTGASKDGRIGPNPPDVNKWTVITGHILDHYLKGWANGYSFPIEYVELWNEPDLGYWSGGEQKFFELNKVALTTLKASYPNIKFGTCAIANIFKSRDFVDRLLAYLSTNGPGGGRVPLDFFSWHVYGAGKGLKNFVTFAGIARDLLNKYGYQNTMSFCTEFNASLPNPYLQTKNAAIDIASTLIWAKTHKIDAVFFYPMIDTWGLIRSKATSLDYKTFQPTTMSVVYNQMGAIDKEGLGQVPVQGASDSARAMALASSDQQKIRVLVTTKNPVTTVKLMVKGVSGGKYQVAWSSLEDLQFTAGKSETLTAGAGGTLSCTNDQISGPSLLSVTFTRLP